MCRWAFSDQCPCLLIKSIYSFSFLASRAVLIGIRSMGRGEAGAEVRAALFQKKNLIIIGEVKRDPLPRCGGFLVLVSVAEHMWFGGGRGGVLAHAHDGCIYCIPYRASKVLKIIIPSTCESVLIGDTVQPTTAQTSDERGDAGPRWLHLCCPL